MTALVHANFSITKKDEEVEILSIDFDNDSAKIEYPNGYVETMILTALTNLNTNNHVKNNN